MILLLLVVGLLYSIWGKIEDAITIFLVISILITAEVYNEYRAKKAIASLAKAAAPKARTIRDGGLSEIDAEDVVPGDLLVLIQGTRIAADAGIVKAVSLQTDESALTGESFPQDKGVGDKVYAGTTVLFGEGEAEVLSTGGKTHLGQIASELKSIRPPKTLLQIEMKFLVGKLVYVAVFFSTLIPVIGIFRGQDLKTMVLTGLSLSFATIPEELPIIITMVLGLGSYTLSKHNFLIKKLQSAETLGNATVIVTDKTGTLTRGEVRISSIYPDDREEEVLEAACGALTEYVLTPMEAEIRRRAKESGADKRLPDIFRQRKLGEGGRKTKTVIRRGKSICRMFMSGAPEEVFAACGGPSEEIQAKLTEESSKGMRVIAVASRVISAGEENLAFSEIEKDLEFCGLIGFEDPPREGVKETISIVAGAGIRTIMVTGDHPLTAIFTAKKIGIPTAKVLEGKDLDEVTDEELSKSVNLVSVFARTTPEHKYRIVKALQRRGEVVAVTGDGINDVLALKGADIGIAMGLRGTDVAKEAADAVLADDNYITITRGIFEGRKFFDNLQKGITYYLAVKVALIMIFLLPALLGIPLPFSPIQIVIIELFMDLAASAGFVAEPEEKNLFLRPPRNPKEKVLSSGAITDFFQKGLALFVAVLVAYFYALHAGMGLRETQTFAFCSWIFGHILLAAVSRSKTETVFSRGIFTNKVINVWAIGAVFFLFLAVFSPFVGARFNLVPIRFHQMLAIAASTLIPIGALELKKFMQN